MFQIGFLLMLRLGYVGFEEFLFAALEESCHPLIFEFMFFQVGFNYVKLLRCH